METRSLEIVDAIITTEEEGTIEVEAPILFKIDLMISSPIPNSAAKFVTKLGILLLTVIIAWTIHSTCIILLLS